MRPTSPVFIDLRNLARAHLYHGQYLSAQGKFEEAVAEPKAAMQLDPSSQLYNQGLCAMLSSAGQYDESIQQCRKLVEMYPDVSMVHSVLSDDYLPKRDFGAALQQLQLNLTRDGHGNLAVAIGQA